MYNSLMLVYTDFEYCGKIHDVYADLNNRLYFYQKIMTSEGIKYFSPLFHTDELKKAYEKKLKEQSELNKSRRSR